MCKNEDFHCFNYYNGSLSKQPLSSLQFMYFKNYSEAIFTHTRHAILLQEYL
jgi:hypothetical protein